VAREPQFGQHWCIIINFLNIVCSCCCCVGDFSAKVGRKDVFKSTIGNSSLHENSNDSGVIAVNFSTSKNIVVKITMFPHLKIHKFNWTSPDGKTHKQIDHILTDRSRHSSVLDVRSLVLTTILCIDILWWQNLGID
jgi:hypothetical protein